MSEVKSKRNFKKNEVILIAFLGILLYGAVVIKMLILPEYTKMNASKERQMTITQSFDHVNEQLANIETLKMTEADVKKKLLFEGSKIPPVLDRERILLSMTTYSKKSNVIIDGYSFSGQQIFPFEGFVVGPGANNAVLDPKTIEADAEVMIVSTVNMSFRTYEDGLYAFLKAFEKSEPSLYLKTCAVQLDEATGELIGSASMEYLAYKGKLAEYNSLLNLKPSKGKRYVFPSALDIIENNKILEDLRIKEEMERINNLPAGDGSSNSNDLNQESGASTSNF